MHVRHALVTLAIIVAVSVAIVRSGGGGNIVMRSGDGKVSARVAYGDLDLGSPAGARTVLGRIQGAAGRICDESHDTIEGRAQYQACVDAVTQRAIGKLGGPVAASMNGGAQGASTAMLSASR